jgi:hypothetical protein
MPGDRTEVYRVRRAEYEAARAVLARRSRLVSYLRVAVFAAAAGALIAALDGSLMAPPAAWLAVLALVITFGTLLVHHARLDREDGWLEALARVNAESEARLRRDWSALPVPETPPEPFPAFATDLDLFGRASLLQWLNPSLAPGASLLAGWLIQPAAPVTVRLRQESVAELAPMLDFRERLAAHGRLAAAASARDVERFVAWAEDKPWLLARPPLLWLIRGSAAATIGLAMAQGLGLMDLALWAVPLTVNLGIMAVYQVRAHELLERAAGPERALRHYSSAFALMAAASFETALLRRLVSQLRPGRVSADEEMNRLDRLHGYANLRLSAAILHFPIQALTLWDFHALAAIERWQRQVGPSVRGWVSGLAETDALAAMAAVRHDNPSWATPELVEPDDRVLDARGLAHPLIPDGTRVANDVQIGPPGTFLFVTGSNMSGKSTLLRAVGVNVVLAQAGGPACAASLRLPPLSVETSMRLQDSLEAGVSFFMAALQRLKEVVDAARAAEREDRPALLYLLDEILQGTNTAERQVASRRIIAWLLRHGAIGAVTSHDLALIDTPDLSHAARSVHFTETVHGPEAPEGLSFDYRLRPGIATSSNALRLMRLVGIDPDA